MNEGGPENSGGGGRFCRQPHCLGIKGH
jgi:hypothetical protein